jgi:hypothetical protein
MKLFLILELFNLSVEIKYILKFNFLIRKLNLRIYFISPLKLNNSRIKNSFSFDFHLALKIIIKIKFGIKY